MDSTNLKMILCVPIIFTDVLSKWALYPVTINKFKKKTIMVIIDYNTIHYTRIWLDNKEYAIFNNYN